MTDNVYNTIYDDQGVYEAALADVGVADDAHRDRHLRRRKII